MKLSRKQMTFQNLFFHFGNLDSILTICKRKDHPQSSCIFELTDSEKLP